MNFQLKTIIAAVLVLSPFSAARAQVLASNPPYTLEQTVIASGGGTRADTGGVFSITGAIGQAAAGAVSTNSAFTVNSGFFTPLALAPTAAGVTISGRVRTANGNGIRNVRITLTNSDGTTSTTLSSSFGYYNFENVAAGQVVIVTAAGKRFSFSQPHILNVSGDIEDNDFVANEQW